MKIVLCLIALIFVGCFIYNRIPGKDAIYKSETPKKGSIIPPEVGNKLLGIFVSNKKKYDTSIMVLSEILYDKKRSE